MKIWPFKTSIHALWMKRVEGPYLALHQKSKTFRAFVQVVAVVGLVLAIAVGLFGLAPGLGGVAAISLMAVGEDLHVPVWLPFAMLAAGVLLSTLGFMLGIAATRFMRVRIQEIIKGLIALMLGLSLVITCVAHGTWEPILIVLVGLASLFSLWGGAIMMQAIRRAA